MREALRVLVPADGSEPARRATQHVLDLAARGLSVEVHLLNVQPAVRGVAASLVSAGDLEHYHREEGMKALAESMQLVVDWGGAIDRARTSTADSPASGLRHRSLSHRG